MSQNPPIYCVDTSSLLGAFTRHYPRQAFPGFWREFEQLIQVGRVVAPTFVYDEIKVRKDAIADWAKQHSQMFKAPDLYTYNFVRNIGIDFPATVTTTIASNKADPWLVAFGSVKKWIVVTEERHMSGEIPTIPEMCKRYSVSYMPIVRMIVGEGWVFT